jgi:membrane protein required for colicin V production
MILDLIAAVIITYLFYRGYNKGLLKTVVDTLSIVVGIVIALKFSPLVIGYLQKAININPALEFILGFIIVFFAVMLLLRFIADKIEDLLEAIKINFINQIAGGVLMAAFGAFIIGSILLLMTNLKIINQEYAAQSTLFEYLTAVGREGGWVLETFKNLFSEFWTKFTATLDQVKDNLEK